MSRVNIVVPPSLRQFVGGKAQASVEATTVRQALEAFAADSPSLRGHLFDADDGLRRFVRVFVDGKPTTIQKGHEEAVFSGAEITILLALAGG